MENILKGLIQNLHGLNKRLNHILLASGRLLNKIIINLASFIGILIVYKCQVLSILTFHNIQTHISP